MPDRMHPTSLGEAAARNLADVTKTLPQMGTLSPRWLLRMLPWADVAAGIYRVNRVRVVGSEFERIETRVDAEIAVLDPRELRSVPAFRSLDDAMLAALAGRFRTVRLAAGATLFEAGEPGRDMYVLCAGSAEVYREAPGQRIVVRTHESGEFFGELALLTGRPRSASVRAVTDIVALRLDKPDLDAVLAENPAMRELLDRVAAERSRGVEVGVALSTARDGEGMVTTTFVDYDAFPEEIVLSSIVTTLRVHTRVMDLYKQPYDQLREQARLVIEAMKERQEWELVNNEQFGLLRRIAPGMAQPTRTGPPTPDDLDGLLSRVWKEPCFFLAHPLAIAAFGRECTKRGVPPPTATHFGAQFLTWRGVPLVPSDKLPVTYAAGMPTSRILLLRVGEDRRGVVGVHQPNIGDERLPSFAIRFNGVDQLGVANYLVSLYFSLAVLADDALGSLDGVELAHYHDRAR